MICSEDKAARLDELAEIVSEWADAESDGLEAEVAQALRESAQQIRTHVPDVFAPHWPAGIEKNTEYRVLCDDKGRNGGTYLSVVVSVDGDTNVFMQDWENVPEGSPWAWPNLRCRTLAGGGKNHRTHQALLWLAQAIHLDAEECKR